MILVDAKFAEESGYADNRKGKVGKEHLKDKKREFGGETTEAFA